jgi:hypothetical protein
MSNEVTLFKAGVPSYLKAKEPDAVTKSLLSGVSTKRISIRGNVFRLVSGGKEIAVSEERAMNVVIVNASPKVSRTYYAGKYVEGVTVSPTCWSADGDRPDPTAKTAQSDACATCPQNVKGSGDNNTRACKFNRVLAVLMENDMGGDLYQLSLPSQSIFGKGENGKLPLNAYAQFLAGFNVNITAVVTEMRFDINSSTPKLFFKAIRPLTEDEYSLCMERGASDEAKQMVTVSFTASDDEAPAPEEAEAPQPAAKAPPKAAPKAKPQPVAAAPQNEEESTPEPVKRDSKEKAPAAKKSLAAMMDEWDDEEAA